MRAFILFIALLFAGAGQAQPQTQTIDKLRAPKVVQKATIDYMCGNIKYRLTTGTNGGICGSGVTVAECTDSKGNSAKVECSKGCSSEGKGSCTIP